MRELALTASDSATPTIVVWRGASSPLRRLGVFRMFTDDADTAQILARLLSLLLSDGGVVRPTSRYRTVCASLFV